MDIIASWAAGLTAASITGALVCLLAPSDKSEKLIRTLAAVFVITAALSPLLSKKDIPGNPFVAGSTHDFSEDISQSIVRQGEIAVRAAVEQVLISCGADDYEIYVSVVADGENGVKVEALEVVLAAEFKEKTAAVFSELVKIYPECTVR
ncbi:MAG: hypothetical protein GX051_02665 [Clostridiales bacterium]|nr:hypothetical protein [Clostridiales bacterium]